MIVRRFDRIHHLQLLHLRIGEDLIYEIDVSTRHACVVQAMNPGGAAGGRETPLDLGRERVAIFGTQGRGRIPRIGQEFRSPDGGRESLPHLLATGSDVDMAVGGLERTGGNVQRMIVARLLWHFARVEPARGLEIQHKNLRRQQRSRDPLAFSRSLPLD